MKAFFKRNYPKLLLTATAIYMNITPFIYNHDDYYNGWISGWMAAIAVLMWSYDLVDWLMNQWLYKSKEK